MKLMSYQFAVAGSTGYSQAAAAALAADPRFNLNYVITPSPRHIGRKQELLRNPLHAWAEAKKLPTFLLENNLAESIFRDFTQDKKAIDFLLVLDFGYFIPKWLLSLAKIAPVNIHPSLLPKWRGSSPAQFALLFQDYADTYFGQQLGGKQSAVTLMVMNQHFDQGPIISQLPFVIQDNWDQQDYYDYAFQLICPRLADLLSNFAQQKISLREQPLSATTPIARRLNKEDSYVAWPLLQQLLTAETAADKALQTSNGLAKNAKLAEHNQLFDRPPLLMNLLNEALICPNQFSQKQLLVNAGKAFQPKPGLWTIVSTKKGDKRMKLLQLTLKETSLVLAKVQIEGQQPATFAQIKNLLAKN